MAQTTFTAHPDFDANCPKTPGFDPNAPFVHKDKVYDDMGDYLQGKPNQRLTHRRIVAAVLANAIDDAFIRSFLSAPRQGRP